MIELLGNVPEWVGYTLAAVIGWLVKVGYDLLKMRLIPYQQDEERIYFASTM